MLQLGSTQFEVDGVTVFQDHADLAQFWYLANRVAIDKRPDATPAFSLILYRPAVAAAGVKGGGFLSFQSVVVLPPETRQRILGRIGALAPAGQQARLAPAPIERGTVRCLALNLEGGGGTSATPPPPGAFNAVTKILGATKPSLSGEETAAFSLVLDQEGAIILKKAFEQGATPVGVIYELEYSALTPSLHVEITADFERIYTHFSAGVEAQIYWVRAGIDAGFEKLVQEGAITVKVIDFDPTPGGEPPEKWALDFFKNDLLAKWFEPSLDLGVLKGSAQPEGLDAVLERLKKLTQPSGDTKPSGGDTKPSGGDAPGAAVLSPAALTITQTVPSPLPAGYGLSLVPGSTTTTETLEVTGPAGAVVMVGTEAKVLDASRRTTVVVPATTTVPITVDWPASAPVDETFKLFFTFDQPRARGFAPTRTNPIFASYLSNDPKPPDARFSQSTGPRGTAPPSGAAALQDWLDDRLVAPKDITVQAHASFEGDDSNAQLIFNRNLSERRLAIARGIIGNRASIIAAQAFGFSRAAGLIPPRIDDANDRVAEITGKVRGDSPAVAIRATLARGASATPTAPKTPTTPTTPTTITPKTPTSAGGLTPALLSFKLKFIRQEERKKLTLTIDKKKAVVRQHNPQGFIGFLLDELVDKSKHIVEVDLDDPFFRELKVDIVTPVDFARIGLFSSDVMIEYGDPADAANHKRQEFQLTAADRGPKQFAAFLNAKHELAFKVGFQHHFDANSGWIGERLTYEIPPRESADRTLNVDPADDLGFLELEVFPNRIDAGIVDAIDVDLSYDDGATFQRSDTFRVVAGGPKQLWRLRLSQPERRDWTANLTHHLRNGGTLRSGPITSDASFLPVNDPFVAALDIRAIPQFGPGEVRNAFVDITYDDPANNYHREERLELAGDSTVPVAVRIALLDANQRTFRHRVTVVGADGALTQKPPVDGTETLIGVGP